MRTLCALAVALCLSTTAAGAQTCFGDCNEDNRVSISELVLGVQIALGRTDARDCRCWFGSCGSGPAGGITDLIRAVGNALSGCGCPDVFGRGAGLDRECVFLGTFSEQCPREAVEISFFADGGNARNPRIIFSADARPLVSFLWLGFDTGLRYWSDSGLVTEQSNFMIGTAAMIDGGKTLILERTQSGNPEINGCRFDRFVGTFIGFD